MIAPNHHAVQLFIDYLKFEKRYPDNTVQAYQSDLDEFTEFLITYMDMKEPVLTDVSASMVRSWLVHLKEEKKNAARSINRKVSTLKSFFKYHLRRGHLVKTPMSSVTAPKIGKRVPQYVDQQDMTTLLDAVAFPDTWKGHTEKLLLTVFYNTGMRLSELVNLKESQVNAGGHSLKVLGKGNKERIIPVSPELITSLQHYMSRKRSELENPDTTYLLVSEKGKQLVTRSVYQSVNTWLKTVTTIEKKSPHVLRHTFATHLMNNGADINAVKELLGHSSLAATQVYTHNTIEKLKDIHKKAHPKA